jgi:hypothetical protein
MALCPPPINPCPCHPWAIGPGETLPLIIDWSAWLASVPGFSLHGVASVVITDLNVSPTVPADADDIDTVPPLAGWTPPATDATAAARIINGMASESLIKVGADVPMGRVFRYDIQVTARDCDGRLIAVSDCVFIRVAWQ